MSGHACCKAWFVGLYYAWLDILSSPSNRHLGLRRHGDDTCLLSATWKKLEGILESNPSNLCWAFFPFWLWLIVLKMLLGRICQIFQSYSQNTQYLTLWIVTICLRQLQGLKHTSTLVINILELNLTFYFG